MLSFFEGRVSKGAILMAVMIDAKMGKPKSRSSEVI